MKRYDMEFSMYIPIREKTAIQKMARDRGITVSSLIRKCAVYDYRDNVARIRGDDCFVLLNTVKDAIIAIGDINNASDSELSLKDNKADEIYKTTEKIRQRIRKYAVKKILAGQMAFFESADSDKQSSTFKICLTNEEYDTLSKAAASDGLSPAFYIRKSIFEKCLPSPIYIDSYPLDDLNRSLKEAVDMLSAIAGSVKQGQYSRSDIMNARELVQTIRTLLNEYKVPSEQKETRKEANRIVNINS